MISAEESSWNFVVYRIPLKLKEKRVKGARKGQVDYSSYKGLYNKASEDQIQRIDGCPKRFFES